MQKPKVTRTLLRAVVLLAILPLCYLIVAMRAGGVVPDDFVESTLDTETLRSDDWRIYGHQEWAFLAIRLSSEQKTAEAEVAAKRALAASPGYNFPPIFLMGLYAQANKPDDASKMYNYSKQLWPAKHKLLFKE